MRFHDGSSWAVLFLLTVAGCTPVGSSGPAAQPQPPAESAPPVSEPPPVAGLWTGFISVEGQGINGTLDLGQEGGDLEAVFDAPDFGLHAEGGGTIDGTGEIVLRLGYDLQCPGTAELVGRRSADGAVLEGALTAADCTGSSQGSFTFRR